MMTFKKTKNFLKKFIEFKKINGLSLGLALTFFASVGVAKAETVGPLVDLWNALGSVAGDLLADAAYGAAMALSYLIVKFLGWLIVLESQLLVWVLSIENFTTMPIVQLGWRVCRDLSFVFFSVILIVVAFTTMLRIQKMGAKDLLFKIILMAILINFSMTICGMIIDFSQVVFKFLIYASLPVHDQTPTGFSTAIASILDIQKMFSPKLTDVDDNETSLTTTLSLIFVVFAGLGFVIIFGLLVVAIFVRSVFFWILLIFAPIAWTLSVAPLPMLKKLSGDWWKNFLKWTFMGPAMAFPVFLVMQLTLYTGNGAFTSDQVLWKNNAVIGDLAREEGPNANVISVRNQDTGNPSIPLKVGVIFSLLASGIFFGVQQGAPLAGAVAKGVEKKTKQFAGFVGRQTGLGASKVGYAVGSNIIAPTLGKASDKIGGAWNSAAEKLGGMGIVGKATSKVMGGVGFATGAVVGGGSRTIMGALKGNQEKNIAQKMKKYETYSEEGKREVMLAGGASAVAAFRLLGKDGKNPIKTQAEYNSMSKALSGSQYKEDLKKLNDNNPHFNPEVQKDIVTRDKTVKEATDSGGNFKPTPDQKKVIDNATNNINIAVNHAFNFDNLPKEIFDSENYKINKNTGMMSPMAKAVLGNVHTPEQLNDVLKKTKDIVQKRAIVSHVVKNQTGDTMEEKIRNFEKKSSTLGYSFNDMVGFSLPGLTINDIEKDVGISSGRVIMDIGEAKRQEAREQAEKAKERAEKIRERNEEKRRQRR